MNASPARWCVAATAIAGLTFGGCGLFRPSVTLRPLGIERVGTGRPAGLGSAALRLNFYSRPELLAEESAIISEHVRFCDATDERERPSSSWSLRYSDAGISSWSTAERQQASDKTRPQSGPVVYSIYVSVRQPQDRGDYDLMAQPRPLCAWLSLFVPYDAFSRTTNTMTFSAAQVAAALGVQQ